MRFPRVEEGPEDHPAEPIEADASNSYVPLIQPLSGRPNISAVQPDIDLTLPLNRGSTARQAPV